MQARISMLILGLQVVLELNMQTQPHCQQVLPKALRSILVAQMLLFLTLEHHPYVCIRGQVLALGLNMPTQQHCRQVVTALRLAQAETRLLLLTAVSRTYSYTHGLVLVLEPSMLTQQHCRQVLVVAWHSARLALLLLLLT